VKIESDSAWTVTPSSRVATTSMFLPGNAGNPIMLIGLATVMALILAAGRRFQSFWQPLVQKPATRSTTQKLASPPIV
jgi:hypothetical protein